MVAVAFEIAAGAALALLPTAMNLAIEAHGIRRAFLPEGHQDDSSVDVAAVLAAIAPTFPVWTVPWTGFHLACLARYLDADHLDLAFHH